MKYTESQTDIYSSLDEAIHNLFGSARTIKQKQLVSGGDINDAFVLTLDDGAELFMKSNRSDFLPNFSAEAAGLDAIRRTGAIGVPEVLGMGVDASFSFLLLEQVRGARKVKDYWETFAAELAAMHGADLPSPGQYGFHSDNWIGARRQINTPKDSWIAFFRDCRLKPQIEAAAGYFSTPEMKKIDHLLSHLDKYLTEPEKPALIHGDLWAGNMITANDGKAWLIDPAVYYGHPEADIAMTELFGGFAPAFYKAYQETGMLGADYKDRRDLYNLYHLLNHLNMFGNGYLGEVLRIIKRYA